MLTDFTVCYNKIYFLRSKDDEQMVFENLLLNIFCLAGEKSECWSLSNMELSENKLL